MKSLRYKVLCGSFDRTDIIWFNNEMTLVSATSVPQSHTHTHSIPPPIPHYRQLMRSTLILNKQHFLTSLYKSGVTPPSTQQLYYVLPLRDI